MVTMQQFFRITRFCNAAYRISNTGVIMYVFKPGEWVEVNWKNFLEWHDAFRGFSEEDQAEIDDAERDDRTPLFDSDDAFKKIEWAIGRGLFESCEAQRKLTDDELDTIRRYACVCYEVNSMGEDEEGYEDAAREVEYFWDDEDENACAAFDCLIGHKLDWYHDVDKYAKVGDVYYINVDSDWIQYN